MAKNGLSLDDINARLGKSANTQRSFDDYVNPHDNSDEATEEDDSSSKMGAGFMATVFVAFLAIAGGTFMWTDGGFSLPSLHSKWGDAERISIVDPICKKYWVPGGRNDEALQCYLTTNIRRLCDANERKHLADMVKRYRLDVNTAGAQMMVGGLQVALKGRAIATEMMSDVMKEAKINPSSTSEAAKNQEILMKHGMRVASKMNELTGALDTMLGPRNMLKIDPAVMAKHIRNIGERGYMDQWDFGWLKDPMVDAAFTSKKFKASKTDPCAAEGT